MSILALLFWVIVIFVAVTLALKWLPMNVVFQRILIGVTAVIILLLVGYALGIIPAMGLQVPRVH